MTNTIVPSLLRYLHLVLVVCCLHLDACGTTGTPSIGPELTAVTTIDFSVGDGRKVTSLVPGKAVKFTVRLTDTAGKVYSTDDNTIDISQLKISSQLATYNSSTNTITPERNFRKVNGQPYTISVQYGSEERLKVTKNFSADFAAIKGPEPKDVIDLSVTVGTDNEQRFLIPGEKVKLRVVAIDKNGRIYGTDGSELKLPVERLQVSTRGMAWDPEELTLVPDEDLQNAQNYQYQIDVHYQDRLDLSQTKSFIPDLAMLRGPEPKDVVALSVSFGELGDISEVEPGSKLKLIISATDLQGRIFNSADKRFNLPPERFRVVTQNMAYDPKSSLLYCESDFKKLLGDGYGLTVFYEGREDLRVTKVLKPDLLGNLKPFFVKDGAIALRAKPGEEGEAGRTGRDGSGGRASTASTGTGETGRSGTDGEPGLPGRPGQSGPRIQVIATVVKAVDGKTPLILAEITVDDEKPQYKLRRISDPPLRIASIGGKGGVGGVGGVGGAGGSGGDGYNTGHGANGGNGGEGGRGGPGGVGGDVNLVIPIPELRRHFILESKGGPGGEGGKAGEPGHEGLAGKPIGSGVDGAEISRQIQGLDNYSRSLSNQRMNSVSGVLGAISAFSQALPSAPPQRSSGNDGRAGKPGYQGQPGVEGRPGRTNVTENEDPMALKTRVPKELADNLIFP